MLFDRWKGFVAGCAIAACWTTTAAAQSTFVKVPIAIENVSLTTAGIVSLPLSMPVSAPIHLVPPCGAARFGTVTLDIVDNGIEVAFAGNTFDCGLDATLRFDVVFDVPVVSLDAVAYVALSRGDGAASLSNSPVVSGAKGRASLNFEGTGPTTSVLLGSLRSTTDWSAGFAWTPDPTELLSGPSATLLPFVPGDEVRIPMSVRITVTPPAGGGNLGGSFSGRIELKTPLPLPVSGVSPSLSIPIGVMGLSGLARLRL